MATFSTTFDGTEWQNLTTAGFINLFTIKSLVFVPGGYCAGEGQCYTHELTEYTDFEVVAKIFYRNDLTDNVLALRSHLSPGDLYHVNAVYVQISTTSIKLCESWGTVATHNRTMTVGTTDIVKFSCVSDTYNVYLNDVLILGPFTSTTYPLGYVGFGTESQAWDKTGSGIVYDEYSFTDLAAAAGPTVQTSVNLGAGLEQKTPVLFTSDGTSWSQRTAEMFVSDGQAWHNKGAI